MRYSDREDIYHMPILEERSSAYNHRAVQETSRSTHTCMVVARAGSVAYILGAVVYDDLKEPKVGESGYCVGDMGLACSQSKEVRTTT